MLCGVLVMQKISWVLLPELRQHLVWQVERHPGHFNLAILDSP
jgi:hypothetical protein